LAYTRDDVPVTEFTQQVDLSISYIDGYSLDVPEDKLAICYLDSAKNNWIPVDSSWVDKNHKVVHGLIGDFGKIYAILGYIRPQSICSNFRCFPNPFRAGSQSTRLAYTLTRYASIKIRIFTIVGAPVMKWEFDYDSPMGRGTGIGNWHTLEWDGRNMEGRLVGNGTYIADLTATDINGGVLCEERALIGVIR
jgi:hypothetical protein